jgi:hypothetical protein
VSWIHHDRYVGWVPLGPRETYYSHRRWGGTHDALYTGNITRISINIGSFAYAGHAIIVPRDNFYRVDDYRTVRVRTINPTTIINNYYAAPVVNNTVINNYQTDTRRHTFTTRAVEEKPHASVLRRIETNEADIRRGTKADSVTVRKEVRTLKEGRVSRDGGIEAPIITNYIVPVSEVNRPISELKLQQRRVKTGAKSQAARDGAGQPRQAVEQPVQPAEQSQVQKLEKAPGKKPGKGKPAGAVVEQPRQAVEQPGQPAEQPQVQKLEKAPGKKPGKGQPEGQETVQPEVLETGDSSVENQPETELTKEELEMLRLQEEQGQEKGNSRGKSGKR